MLNSIFILFNTIYTPFINSLLAKNVFRIYNAKTFNYHRAIDAPTKDFAASRREGYIYFVVEPLIFRVQIGNVAATSALAYGLE